MIIPLRDDADFPRLVFICEVIDWDIAPQGIRGDVTVELRDGEAFPICFYEPTAVREDLDGRIEWGFGRFVAAPGLVIIPEISVANMKASVLELIEIGYFAHLRPIAEVAVNKTPNSTGKQPD